VKRRRKRVETRVLARLPAWTSVTVPIAADTVAQSAGERRKEAAWEERQGEEKKGQRGGGARKEWQAANDEGEEGDREEARVIGEHSLVVLTLLARA
jgi:hypothetical protein